MSNLSRKRIAILIMLASFILITFTLNISFGPVPIDSRLLWEIILGRETSGPLVQIVWQVRFPRTMAALLVGMALAASGTVLQGVMQNPLAAPSLIGVNAGAGLAAMLVFAFLPGRVGLVVPGAFIGALLALGIILLITSRTSGDRSTLILAGVAVSAMLGAGTDTIRLLYPDAMLGATTFMIGGFANTSWSRIAFALPWLIGSLGIVLLTGPILNVVGLGDEVALSLGVPVRQVRLALLALSAVLAGSSVSIAGLLGFIGLIVPHASRLLLGNDQRWLLPGTMLLGGGFVLACDLVSRLLFAPYELPVGILLSFLGGPFFIILLLRTRRET